MASRNRKIIYVVLRSDGVVLDSFRTYPEAEDRAGVFQQMFKERGIEDITFQVVTSCYYDF